MSLHSRAPLAAAAVLVAGVCAASQAAPANKFAFPTGRIVYKLTNPMMNGTSTLTWAEYGKKIRQEMSAKANINGKSMDLKTWVISDGQNLYSHNPMQGNVVNRTKLTPAMLQQAGGGPMVAAPKNLGKPIGKATVAGKPCAIHALPQVKGAKMWVWQNLPLKMEMSGPQGPGMKMEATKVETGIPVAATTFKVPAGMQVKDFQMPKAPAGGPAPRKK